MQIKNFSQLKNLCKQSEKLEQPFEVRILLGNGLFTRKTVYQDFGCFNYIDETETNFENKSGARKYWNRYFKDYVVIFDGYT